MLHQRSDGRRGRRAESVVLCQALQQQHWPVTFCWPQMPVTQATDFIEDELVRARKDAVRWHCAHTITARRTRDSPIGRRLDGKSRRTRALDGVVGAGACKLESQHAHVVSCPIQCSSKKGKSNRGEVTVNTLGRIVLHQRSDGRRGRRAESVVLCQALQQQHWPVTFCWPQMPVTQATDFIEDELVRA